MSAYDVPGTVLGTGDTSARDLSCPDKAYILVEEINKKTNKISYLSY